MKRRCSAAVSGWVGVFLLCAGAAFSAPREMPLWRLTLQEKLRTPVTVAFRDTPLPEALDFFRTTLEVNIVLDSRAEAGEKLVTLQMRDVPAERALLWAVRQARLEYVLSDGVIFVTTREIARKSEPVYFRQQDVSDLLVPLPAPRDTQSAATGTETTSAGTATSATARSGRSAESEDLLALIVIFTGVENWDEVGVAGAPANNEETLTRTQRP